MFEPLLQHLLHVFSAHCIRDSVLLELNWELLGVDVKAGP